MKIIPLSEGSFTIDKTKEFVPFDIEIHDLQNRSKGSLLVEIQPFVVITSNDILLLDTGLGFKKNGRLQLHQNLMDNGIDPASVTKVLMSHLHRDHAGGVTVLDKWGDFELAFPQATYYVQQQELEYALESGLTSYVPAQVQLLAHSSQVVLLPPHGVIDHYIRYELTGGHCPYHQAYWIEEDGETILFGGDVAPQYHQLKSRMIAKYDADGKTSMEKRQEWYEEGSRQGWTFLFYHDIDHAIWKATNKG